MKILEQQAAVLTVTAEEDGAKIKTELIAAKFSLCENSRDNFATVHLEDLDSGEVVETNMSADHLRSYIDMLTDVHQKLLTRS